LFCLFSFYWWFQTLVGAPQLLSPGRLHSSEVLPLRATALCRGLQVVWWAPLPFLVSPRSILFLPRMKPRYSSSRVPPRDSLFVRCFFSQLNRHASFLPFSPGIPFPFFVPLNCPPPECLPIHTAIDGVNVFRSLPTIPTFL